MQIPISFSQYMDQKIPFVNQAPIRNPSVSKNNINACARFMQAILRLKCTVLHSCRVKKNKIVFLPPPNLLTIKKNRLKKKKYSHKKQLKKNFIKVVIFFLIGLIMILLSGLIWNQEWATRPVIYCFLSIGGLFLSTGIGMGALDLYHYYVAHNTLRQKKQTRMPSAIPRENGIFKIKPLQLLRPQKKSNEIHLPVEKKNVLNSPRKM